MSIRGRVKNGVVVLEEGPAIPEGMAVIVVCPDAASVEPVRGQRRVELPLVRSEHPGSVLLTPERVAELLEDVNVSA
jgi:hypothetical protein